jgi:hypothetical protein
LLSASLTVFELIKRKRYHKYIFELSYSADNQDTVAVKKKMRRKFLITSYCFKFNIFYFFIVVLCYNSTLKHILNNLNEFNLYLDCVVTVNIEALIQIIYEVGQYRYEFSLI